MDSSTPFCRSRRRGARRGAGERLDALRRIGRDRQPERRCRRAVERSAAPRPTAAPAAAWRRDQRPRAAGCGPTASVVDRARRRAWWAERRPTAAAPPGPTLGADPGERRGLARPADVRSVTDHRLVPTTTTTATAPKASHGSRKRRRPRVGGRRAPAERSRCGQARSARCWGAHLHHRAAHRPHYTVRRGQLARFSGGGAAASAAARSFTDAAYMST